MFSAIRLRVLTAAGAKMAVRGGGWFSAGGADGVKGKGKTTVVAGMSWVVTVLFVMLSGGSGLTISWKNGKSSRMKKRAMARVNVSIFD